jgi:molybdate transport system substrate-binding protein
VGVRTRRHRSPVLVSLAVAACVALAALTALAARAEAKSQARITVYAAASLTDVLPRIDGSPRYSFAGSSTLAAQIQQGAPADVFASADMTLPSRLHAQRLCAKPVAFARNELVIVVPRSNPAHIRRVRDLARPGVKVAVAGPAAPVGAYTLELLKRLELTAPVTTNVVSRETDVRAVLSKIALGEADAGFVYSTDAKTVPGRVTVIKVPARAQPKVLYGMCIVDASDNKADGQAFVAKVLSKAGQAKLVAAGFLPRAKSKPASR